MFNCSVNFHSVEVYWYIRFIMNILFYVQAYRYDATFYYDKTNDFVFFLFFSKLNILRELTIIY